MCYEDKVAALADAIAPHVQFDTVEEAKEFVVSYRCARTDTVPMQIEQMAEKFIEDADRIGISAELRSIGSCVGTRLSALREAIRMCAERFVGTAGQPLSMEVTA